MRPGPVVFRRGRGPRRSLGPQTPDSGRWALSRHGWPRGHRRRLRCQPAPCPSARWWSRRLDVGMHGQSRAFRGATSRSGRGNVLSVQPAVACTTRGPAGCRSAVAAGGGPAWRANETGRFLWVGEQRCPWSVLMKFIYFFPHASKNRIRTELVEEKCINAQRRYPAYGKMGKLKSPADLLTIHIVNPSLVTIKPLPHRTCVSRSPPDSEGDDHRRWIRCGTIDRVILVALVA